MMTYLVDTDTFSLYAAEHPKVVPAVMRYRKTDSVVLPVIAVREVWRGLVALVDKARTSEREAAAYDLMTETVNDLREWPVVGFPLAAIRRYVELKQQKLNVGANDLKIGAIALEAGATVVTRNRRDFGRIPGLQIVDWSA
ncbi:MAG: type II toxin-antitoxin system VapC family toxin [Gemmataceae bacterium]|nr:type II toxin-antitoxin system VapC family toxin [Gemmataceae bacterium]